MTLMQYIMKIRQTICLCIVAGILNGCLAAGIPYTSDPAEQADWALHLTVVGRSIGARNILRGTVEKFDASDKKTLATFYRADASMIASDMYQENDSH